MPVYFTIKDGRVVGSCRTATAIADASDRGLVPAPDNVADPASLLGATYDAQTDTFTPAPPFVDTRVSKFDFSQLFTAAERAALRAARAAGVNVALVDAADLFELLTYVDLSDSRVPGYLDLLIASGIILAPRKAAILAGQAPA